MLVLEGLPETDPDLDADCVPDDDTVADIEVEGETVPDCDWDNDPVVDKEALVEVEAEFEGVFVGDAENSNRQTNC